MTLVRCPYCGGYGIVRYGNIFRLEDKRDGYRGDVPVGYIQGQMSAHIYPKEATAGGRVCPRCEGKGNVERD